MRNLIIALGCLLAVLLLAAPAQAYAIYNHVDRDMCVQTSLNVTFNTCKFTIPPNGKHNGERGAGLDHAYVLYIVKGDNCRGNDVPFDIPKGGFVRVYYDVVKIYKHDGKEVGRKGVSDCQCWTSQSSGK